MAVAPGQEATAPQPLQPCPTAAGNRAPRPLQQPRGTHAPTTRLCSFSSGTRASPSSPPASAVVARPLRWWSPAPPLGLSTSSSLKSLTSPSAPGAGRECGGRARGPPWEEEAQALIRSMLGVPELMWRMRRWTARASSSQSSKSLQPTGSSTLRPLSCRSCSQVGAGPHGGVGPAVGGRWAGVRGGGGSSHLQNEAEQRPPVLHQLCRHGARSCALYCGSARPQTNAISGSSPATAVLREEKQLLACSGND